MPTSTLLTEWNIKVDIEEDQDHAIATASLMMRDGRVFSARGRARRNPSDRPMPQIGEELACGRALSELSHMLLSQASKEVEYNVRRGDPEW